MNKELDQNEHHDEIESTSELSTPSERREEGGHYAQE